MSKEKIKKFYVGALNFSSNNNYSYLCNHTILRGAIALNDIRGANNKVYKSVYTIFYKKDNGKYLCLHNNQLFGLLGENFVYELSTLEDFLPKLDYFCPSFISFNEALSLFSKLVHNKKLPYFSLLRDATKFYLGTMEICDEIITHNTSYPYNKENYHVNMKEYIPLKNLYLKDGNSKIVDNRVYSFKIYKSVFYIMNNGYLYNVNNHYLYLKNDLNTLKHTISINKNIKDVFYKYKIDERDVTIAKVLKLEKKTFQDVDFL